MSRAPMNVTLAASMENFVRQMAKAAAAVTTMLENNPGFRRLHGLPRRDKHHPAALPIDGVAYRQRRRARRRRSR